MLAIWIVSLACMPLHFEVNGNTAIMTGDLRRNAPQKVARLIENYPELEWIELLDCPGSLDDQAALKASRLVRRAGLNTRVPANGVIASGAVDFFIAGTKREVIEGGKVGVHAWSDGRKEGSDYPKTHSAHQLYLTYYRDMGIGSDFYWFTLNSADSNNLHWMSREELLEYALLTTNESK